MRLSHRTQEELAALRSKNLLEYPGVDGDAALLLEQDVQTYGAVVRDYWTKGKDAYEQAKAQLTLAWGRGYVALVSNVYEDIGVALAEAREEERRG